MHYKPIHHTELQPDLATMCLITIDQLPPPPAPPFLAQIYLFDFYVALFTVHKNKYIDYLYTNCVLSQLVCSTY